MKRCSQPAFPAPRRLLAALLGAAVLALLLTPTAFAGDGDPRSEPRVRVGVERYTPDQWKAYAQAVGVMQERDLVDPASWLFQANVHHVPSCRHNGVALPGCVKDPHDRRTWPEEGRLAWSTCPHGDPMFLSWHRLYVFYMERLLRQASGDESFTLPYWNYSSDEPGPRRLPVALRLSHNQPLFVAERSSQACRFRDYPLVRVNRGEPVARQATLDDKALAAGDWGTFSNEVENSPHNQMHVSLGGFLDRCSGRIECTAENRCGWMASVPTAARDAVFWLHHTNVDRIWNRWLDQAGRSNPPVDWVLRAAWAHCGRNCTDEPSYLRQMCALRGHRTLETCRDQPVFSFFDAGPDGRAVKVEMSPRRLVALSFQPTKEALGYVYDDRVGTPESLLLASALAAPVEDRPAPLGDEPRTITLDVSESTHAEVAEALQELVTEVPVDAEPADEGPERRGISLRIEEIRATGGGPPVGSYEIFLNLPEGTPTADAELWRTASDHYVGSISFFGLTGGGHHALDFVADVTTQVLTQKARGVWSQEVQVTFVPRGPHPEDPAIEIGNVELIVE